MPGRSEASRGPTRRRARAPEPETRESRTGRAREPRRFSSREKDMTVERRLCQIDPHALDLGVFVQRVMAALAAEARLLVPAERKSRIVIVVRVHPHGAGLQRLRRAEGLLH